MLDDGLDEGFGGAMREEELTLDGAQGHRVCFYQWMEAENTSPRAIVLLVHGMAEHAARYRPLATYLVERGFLVLAPDHRGHGKSAKAEELGHLGDRDGWQLVLDDLEALLLHISSRHPRLPLLMLGHSMGSFLALAYALVHGKKLAGLVLSGSNYSPPLLMRLARMIAWVEARRQGPRGKSALVHQLSFGTFNRPFEPAPSPYAWLSRDREQVELYARDKLCGFRCTNQLWVDLLGGLSTLFAKRSLGRLPAELPVYLIGGERDPVGKGGGLLRLAEKLQAAGLTQVYCTVYPDARHEIFNELNRDAVFAELSAWFDVRLADAERNA